MKLRYRFILFIVATFFCLGLTLRHPMISHAEGQKLRVSPVIMQISLRPGTTTIHEATIENLTNTPLPLRASLNDFLTTGEEGGYTFEDTKENPLLSWITLSDSDFLLGAKEKKKVLLKIQTPTTIPVGGYYGILFFEPVLQTKNEQGAQISTKVGILMLANLGVVDPHAKKEEILTFTMPALTTDGTLPFVLRVKNVSLNFFTAKPMLTMKPLFAWNETPKTSILEDKIIFPGKIRRWDDSKTLQNLKPNIYKATMVVSAGNGETEKVEKYMIVLPYGRNVVLIVIGFISILVLLSWKRILAALKALIRP